MCLTALSTVMNKGRLVIFTSVMLAALLLWTTTPRRNHNRLLNESPKEMDAELRSPPLEAAKLEQAARVQVPVERGSDTLKVLVTDVDKRPLSGAWIRLFARTSAAPLSSAQTSSDGVGLLSRPVKSQQHYLEVVKEGFFRICSPLQESEGIHLSLQRARRVEGVLVDASTSRTISYARVSLQHEFYMGADSEETITDDVGQFLLQFPVGEIPVFVVRATGYPRQQARMTVLGDDATLRLSLAIEAGYRITGQVFDANTGTPVAATISSHMNVCQVDAFGGFECFILPNASSDLEFAVSADGYCSLYGRIPPKQLIDHHLRLPMTRGLELNGLVRDTTGALVPGASLSVVEWSSAATPDIYQSLPGSWEIQAGASGSTWTSGEDGAYVVPNLPPLGDRVIMSVSCSDCEPQRSEVLLGARPGGRVTHDFLVVRPVATSAIKGLVSLNGHAVDARIAWQGKTRQGGASAKEGRYKINNVESGEVRLSISVTHLPAMPMVPEGAVSVVHLEAGEELTHDVELSLPLQTISGRIRYANGDSGSDVLVQYYQVEDRVQGEVASDASGAFTLSVPAGQKGYTLQAWSCNEPVTLESVMPGARNVDFVLPDPGTLKIEVLDVDSRERVSDVSIAWRRCGQSDFKQLDSRLFVRDATGNLDISLPVACIELRIGAGCSDYQIAELVAETTPQLAVGRVYLVELEKGVAVTVQLSPTEKSLPRDAEIYLVEASAWEGLQRVARPSGRSFLKVGEPHTRDSIKCRMLAAQADEPSRIAGLSPGLYRFKCFPEDIILSPASIEVFDQDVQLQLLWSQER